jgi:hypothetical protein
VVSIASAKHGDPTQAVRHCQQQLAGIEPRLLIAFCGGKHTPDAILGAMREAFGRQVSIVGGSAAGTIWRGGLSYSGLELTLAAFDDGDPLPRVVSVGGLQNDERAAGRALGGDIAAFAEPDSVVLLFYDSVASAAPLRLHPASAIVEGLQAGLGRKRVRLIGAGMLTDLNFSAGWVFDGREVAKHAAVALVFPPTVGDVTTILHGCRPISSFMAITRIAGAEVYELDGRPALEVIEETLGLPFTEAKVQDLSLIATLGEKQGDPFAPYDENSYVNRVILGTNRATGSVTLFEPDFKLGARVQIMSRDNALMLDSVREGVASANDRIAGRGGLLALYIDCAGRASVRSGAVTEEAEPVRQNLDPALPLIGFYSGVEIGPFGAYSRPLDWTGVLTVLVPR